MKLYGTLYGILKGRGNKKRTMIQKESDIHTETPNLKDQNRSYIGICIEFGARNQNKKREEKKKVKSSCGKEKATERQLKKNLN